MNNKEINEKQIKIKNLEKEIVQLNNNYNELKNQKNINENELKNKINELNNKIQELEKKLGEIDENKLYDNPPNGNYNKCIIKLISKILNNNIISNLDYNYR